MIVLLRHVYCITGIFVIHHNKNTGSCNIQQVFGRITSGILVQATFLRNIFEMWLHHLYALEICFFCQFLGFFSPSSSIKYFQLQKNKMFIDFKIILNFISKTFRTKISVVSQSKFRSTFITYTYRIKKNIFKQYKDFKT